MPDVRFDKYYGYEDLTHILHAYAEEFPQFVGIESIGRSYEERDIWLLTITHFATGSHNQKPAFWVDGNIHATEVAASSVCLYLIQTLVTGYGTHPDITRLEGRAYKPSVPIRRHTDATQDRAKVEWVVCAPQGGTIKLSARHERAGVVHTEVTLQ